MHPDSAAAPRHRGEIPRPTGLSFSVVPGVGTPSFSQRERFSDDFETRVDAEDLVVDQPWDGSSLAPSLGLELSRTLGPGRIVVGGQWSGWSDQAVARDDTTGRLLHQTWRVDELAVAAGFDLFVPTALMRLDGGESPYLFVRGLWGPGRLEGMGRGWAVGSGARVGLGATFRRAGFWALGARLGWSRQVFTSDRSWDVVAYLPGRAGTPLRWEDSRLTLEFVLRLGERRPPTPGDSTARTDSEAPANPAGGG